jgi:hypothetical protein
LAFRSSSLPLLLFFLHHSSFIIHHFIFSPALLFSHLLTFFFLPLPYGKKIRFEIDLTLMAPDKLYELFVGSNLREKQSRLLHHKLRRMRVQLERIILRTYLLQRRMEVLQELSKHIPGKTRVMQLRPDLLRAQTRRLHLQTRHLQMRPNPLRISTRLLFEQSRLIQKIIPIKIKKINALQRRSL